MINTILFDLDGTLLPFHQEDFIDAYFSELEKVFIGLNYDLKQAVKAVWAGTKAMTQNDGSKSNRQIFWEIFAAVMDIDEEEVQKAENACNVFYETEFNAVKDIITPTEIPGRMVRHLKDRGYTLVLATNPLFPACAVETRLKWIGLKTEDFALITHYSNSRFCKPNLGYYEDILKTIDKKAELCLMIGNNTREDMCVALLGAETFLVTDFMEQAEESYPANHQGTLAELEAYLLSL